MWTVLRLIENFSQLHEEVLNDEIREPDPLEDFCEVLNSWLKKKGLAMPYYICVGTSGSGPYLNFIMTCQCHHGSDLAIGKGNTVKIAKNVAAAQMHKTLMEAGYYGAGL
ncbi:hypothetical protein DAPPUDRAFT_244241 [Daphnia pulex]|uniref:DRBM domain-containing protein n=1 Tax=Daphnia pulex TaxID=6669 RepID=E9GKI4_DAPPU|nr:hypothetical protein DAPPUDRAFT_244241 [Daphnia pulex]|eukprot:EFX79999.1 hypothetical protein DAPPUDRAFT_244241 [Daphnia pulex]